MAAILSTIVVAEIGRDDLLRCGNSHMSNV